MKVSGSKIVRGIEKHNKLMNSLYGRWMVRAGLPNLETTLSTHQCETLLKMAETRHVLVEKDFTKIKHNKYGESII